VVLLRRDAAPAPARLHRRSAWSRTAAALAVLALAAGCQGKASTGASGTTAAGASAGPSGAAFPGVPTGPAATTVGHPTRGPLTVASAGYTESDVMAALYSALLTKGGYAVKITAIPITDTLETSLEKGLVDLVAQPAAAYTNQLNALIRGAGAAPVASGDVTATMAQLSPLAVARGLTPLHPTAAVDEYAFAVSKAYATLHNLTTLSDLGRLGTPVRLAAGDDCATAAWCQPGLLRTYGIKVSVLDPLGMDTVVAKNAVLNKKDQLAAVVTTDGMLVTSKLVILTDDKHLQAAGNLVPIVNTKALAAHPDIATDLNKLVAVLSTGDVARMIAAVDTARQRPADVAAAYLRSKSLL
jgi:osmoprotectant transport system substrate-binding protein